MRTIIITGGAGFIGGHVVRLFVRKYPQYKIINLDKLTYAGNLANLTDIENEPNYRFVKMDICDFDGVYKLMQTEHVDGIIHLAAESHVDRSITDPFTFARTNVMGTLSLLQAAKLYWESLPEGYQGKLFYHISTDEVYGALQMDQPQGIPAPHTTKASSDQNHLAYGSQFFQETTKYNPHSPYSASKASSDHFVRAFHDTYGMPTIVTNCSNNYGPYQFPEKLIPLFINNIRNRKPLPVYGTGQNVRDWLYVEDHARAIDTIFHNGKVADTYNIGGFNEWKNIDIVKTVIKTVDLLLGRVTVVGDCPPAGTALAGTASSETALAGTAPSETTLAGTALAGTTLAGTALAGTALAGTAPAGTTLAGVSSRSLLELPDSCFPDMDLITYVTDRLGHDQRYAIDSTKLQKELGWEPSLQFEEGIEKTVRWYLDHQSWLDNITSGAYEHYYQSMYSNR